MRIGDYFGSYLKADDVPNPVMVTIDKVEVEEIKNRETGLTDTKVIVYFDAISKGLVLNKTNATTLEELFSDETNDWLGQNVTLYVDPHVSFAGKTVPGLRVSGEDPKDVAARLNKTTRRPLVRATKPLVPEQQEQPSKFVQGLKTVREEIAPTREPGDDDR